MATLAIHDFPEEVYSRLLQLAETERRSLNAQVVELLLRALEQAERRQGVTATLESIRHLRESIIIGPEYVDSLTLLREDRDS